MYALRPVLRGTGASSVRALRSGLPSPATSVRQLVQTAALHQRYLADGGMTGRFGLPTSDVTFAGQSATRAYRGGVLEVRGSPDEHVGTVVSALQTLSVRVTFVGARCVAESSSDQASSHDEPYFVITVDTLTGIPSVKKFGPFGGTDSGTEIGIGETLVAAAPPNPIAIRAAVYENDSGDPDETAKKLQDTAVELAKEGQRLASASGADAASGPGVGPAAGAATLAGIVAGPFGALAATGVVAVLGLGDDFVGQGVALELQRPEDVTTPPQQGVFAGNGYNARIDVDGGDEGRYELFFDLVVTLNTTVTD